MNRKLQIIVVVVFGIGVLALFLIDSANGRFGGSLTEEDKMLRESSPQWSPSGFKNTEVMYSPVLEALVSMTERSPFASPKVEPMTLKPGAEPFSDKEDRPLTVSWLGHSSLLIGMNKRTFLIDPIFDDRASPWPWIGPAPWYPAPIKAKDLPQLDAVLISHDHYDHLSMDAIQKLEPKTNTFIAPLGVQAHLREWGVGNSKIVTLDWWQHQQIGQVTITATPARHASGRHLTDFNDTLWCGYAIKGPTESFYYSGDTGWTNAFAEIGSRLGPFDVTAIEVGAYHRAWPDWHLGPEHAISAHQQVKGKILLPVHWGRFDLALHGWTEPAERVRVAAAKKRITVHFPMPGETFYPEQGKFRQKPWWPNLPWDSSREHPIPTTQNGDPGHLANVP